MTPKPRIVESIDELQSTRRDELISIFSAVSYRNKNINVYNFSIRNSLIFAISDGKETGQNFTEWRFQTISKSIKASYFEAWVNLGRGNCFLDRSYFHLYTLLEEGDEKEYVLLHCDAAEPQETHHSIYKQSPHLHVEVAEHPIPKAHIALYNGILAKVLKNRTSFTVALRESINMLNSQILQAHPLL